MGKVTLLKGGGELSSWSQPDWGSTRNYEFSPSFLHHACTGCIWHIDLNNCMIRSDMASARNGQGRCSRGTVVTILPGLCLYMGSWISHSDHACAGRYQIHRARCSSMIWSQFHKACKHKNLLSTERYCLAEETGYQPTFISLHRCRWYPAHFSLSTEIW